jgi:hypothetical protein
MILISRATREYSLCTREKYVGVRQRHIFKKWIMNVNIYAVTNKNILLGAMELWYGSAHV